jgi:toxin ParE1/3/4
MPRYKWSSDARRDLEQIRKWIAHDNPVAARRWLERVRAKIQMVCRQPLIGEACNELRAGLRFVLVGDYVVYYTVQGGWIQIVRVVHGARDIDALFPDANGKDEETE